MAGTGPLPAGKRRDLTIDLGNAEGILGLDLSLRYDPSRVAIVAVRRLPESAPAAAWPTASTTVWAVSLYA